MHKTQVTSVPYPVQMSPAIPGDWLSGRVHSSLSELPVPGREVQCRRVFQLREDMPDYSLLPQGNLYDRYMECMCATTVFHPFFRPPCDGTRYQGLYLQYLL